MKKRAIAIAAAAALLVVAVICLRRPGAAPRVQPPLVTLSASNFFGFAAAFDAASSGPRVVVLASPT
jgi:hypothetical protein